MGEVLRAATLLQVQAVPEFDVEPLPKVGDVNQEVWKIDATIPQLSYLSHNIFRYYGKFPSVLARKLIERYSVPGDLVVDNMVGCGTTQVEATLLGRNAVGFDINPLAVMATRVKTQVHRLDEFAEKWLEFNHSLELALRGGLFTGTVLDYEKHIPDQRDLLKWFSEHAIEGLAKVRTLISAETDAGYREFLEVALAAIVRRVSNAYDGEVRPHFNPKKRPRPVLDAFSEKVVDMLNRLRAQRALLPDANVYSKAHLHDARLPVESYLAQTPSLIVSHPPYLNCFNYIPVYKWEMLWLGLPYKQFLANELTSWPATTKVFEEYYEGHQQIVSVAASALKSGGYYCIVIGDCSIAGRIERTHLRFIELVEQLGLRLDTLIYRDTYYATGRYAYSHRAEYNVDAGDEFKRDVVLVFQKP